MKIKKRTNQIIKIITYIRHGLNYLIKSVIYSYIIKNPKNAIITTKEGRKYKIRLDVISDIAMVGEIISDIYACKEELDSKRRSILIDIGAYTGIFSIENSKNFDVIYAIEPLNENYNMLIENIKINKIKNIIPLNYAFGKKDGVKELKIRKPYNLCDGSFYLKEKNIYKKEKVNVKSFKNFLNSIKGEKIVIKMDCEGCEKEIVDEIDYSNSKKIDMIIMEYHYNDKHEHIIKKLKELGFKIFKRVEHYEYKIYIMKR